LRINEYTDNIKQFTDKTRAVINEDEIENNEIINEQEESSLNFTLSKSNLKGSTSNNKNNLDKSLKLNDLSSQILQISNKEEDFFN
jgi:hypothetical protein